MPVCCLMLLSPGILPAQKQGQELIDSLQVVLKRTKEDTGRVKVLRLISYNYHSIDPEKGIRHGEQALELARKLKWKRGMAEAENALGVNYSVGKSDDIRGLEHYLRALKWLEELNDEKRVAGMLNNIGSIYLGQFENEKALDYFQRALNIIRKKGIKPWESLVLENISNIYGQQRKWEESIRYQLQALSINEQLGDSVGVASNLNGLAFKHLAMSELSKARGPIKRAIRIYRQYEYGTDIAVTFQSMGVLLRKAATGNGPTELDILREFGVVQKQQALQLSAKYLDSSIILFRKLNQLDLLSQSYKELAITQELTGDFRGALNSQRLFTVYNDSVFNLEKDKKLTQKSMQYEFDKKEAATRAEQEKKDLRQRNIRNSIALGLAGALIIILVVVRQRNRVKKEKERSDNLLLNILPEEVAEELKSRGEAVARQYNNVTVLFTDFVSFTAASADMTPTMLVAEIHRYFTAFDHIIEKYGLEKIKTIGDAYMAVGGLPQETTDHAHRVVQAALDIRDFVTSANGKFRIRIGIHSGEVVAGIVGVKKFAYDIWGDTVNTASRMESGGEPGKINISAETYELVRESFNCEYRGRFSVKGKGEADMYFVLGKI